MAPSGLARAVAEIERRAVELATELNPDAVPLSEAGRLHDGLDRAGRAIAAAKALLAPRVAASREWERDGHRSAEEALAARSGTSLSAAKTAMATGKAMAGNPTLRDAMARGEVSADQGSVIADAAEADPAATEGLIATAKTATMIGLRAEAGRVKAAADRDPDATYRRLHRARRLSRHTASDGSRHLHLQGPVDAVSVIEAELDRCLSHHIRTLAPGHPRESHDTMAFDAAVAMARRSTRADQTDTEPAPSNGSGAGPDPETDGKAVPTDDPAPNRRRRRAQPAPEHLALLRIDIEALWRGHVEGDEVCEVAGLGPLPVTAARRLLGDAVIKLIITRGEAVAHVTSLTRGPDQAMRYALLWMRPDCTAQSCSRTVLENDHAYGTEYKHTRHTRLDEIDPLCHAHHALHTHRGWALIPGTGKRPMVSPTDPRHPKNTPPSANSGPSPPPSGQGTFRPGRGQSDDHLRSRPTSRATVDAPPAPSRLFADPTDRAV